MHRATRLTRRPFRNEGRVPAHQPPRVLRVGKTTNSIRGRWTNYWSDYGSGSRYPY